MKLLFKQRLFSWFDSYDIFSESGETVYTVRGQLSWGHCLKIYDTNNCCIGTVKEKIFTFLPKYEMYSGENYIGCISKEMSLFHPKYNVDCNGWRVDGNFLEWDYNVFAANGKTVATVSKDVWRFADTYVIDVADPKDTFYVLMLVLAIDAEKCSRRN